VSDSPSYEQLLGLVERLNVQVVELQRVVTAWLCQLDRAPL
jgi:hypothetical protein